MPLITLAMTWPLLPGIARDVPGDLGDSLLNMWILGWGAEHVPRVATGQLSLADFWNANIFHPEPLALSFSEHLFGQVLQILPIYHLTRKPDPLVQPRFLSSIFLSALGMYLLAARSAGRHAKAHDAQPLSPGCSTHLSQCASRKSLTSNRSARNGCRLPYTDFDGFSRRRGLRGASTAEAAGWWNRCAADAELVVRLLLDFLCAGRGCVCRPPDRAARPLREWRVWAGFSVAAAVVASGTLPFLLLLYLEGQRVHGIERPFGEVVKFSADVFSYFTAPEALRLWGRWLQTYPKPEGELFFGLVPLALLPWPCWKARAALGTICASRPRLDGCLRGSSDPSLLSSWSGSSPSC